MAIRIQTRRDTAANWVANNPTLREGEMGIEIDTLKIKIGPTPVSGDATAWNSITAYANIVPTDFNTIADGFLEFTDIGAQGGVVGLDVDYNAIIPGSSIVIEGATDNAYETTLTVTDPTADRTLTLPDSTGTIATEGYVDQAIAAFDALPTQTGNDGKFLQTTGTTTQWATVDLSTKQDKVTGVSDTEIGYLDGVTSGIQGQIDAKLSSSTASSTYQTIVSGVSDTEIGYLDGVTSGIQSQIDSKLSSSTAASTYQTIVSGVSSTEIGYLDGVTSSIQDQIDAKMPKSGGTFTGTVYGTSLELSGDLTVNGTFNSVPTETMTVTNPIIYMGEDNPANVNDLGIVASHTISGTYSHTGLVKDASDGKWKLFTGVTDEPTTTINFAQATLDTLVVSTLEGDVTGDVSGNAGTVTNGVYTTDTGTVTNTMLAGSIANNKLANSSITINGSSVSLGGSTTIDVLPSVSGQAGRYLYTDGYDLGWAYLASSASQVTAGPVYGHTVYNNSATSIGYGALKNGGSSQQQVAFGYEAMMNATNSSASNTALGHYALREMTTSYCNVAVGYNALVQATGGYNTAIGTTAGQSITSGQNNILIGYNAQPSSGSVEAELTIGAYNTVKRMRIPGLSLDTADATNGQVLSWSSTGGGTGDGGFAWTTISGYSAPTIGSTSISSGSTVTTIAGLTLGASSSTSITADTATTVDTLALNGFTTARYTVSIKQGTKIRSSEVIVQTDGTSVDMTEFGITETGGAIAGVLVSAAVSSTNSVLKVTITDASSTNATVKIFKNVM